MKRLAASIHRHLDSYHIRYIGFLLFCAYLFVAGLCLNRPSSILTGLLHLIGSSDRLLTDYMALSNMGTALFNAGLMTLIHLGILHRWRVHLKSPHIAALLTLAGFSLFGKNCVNWIPLFLGVVLYARLKGQDPRESSSRALFVSALGPLVTETKIILTDLFAQWIPGPSAGLLALLGAVLTGLLAGLVFTPLSQAFVNFHQGFSLYNAGFTAGMLAMCANAFFKALGVEIEPREILLHGHNRELFLFLLILQVTCILLGLLLDPEAWANFRLLQRTTGINLPNYTQLFGVGATLVNAGVLGLMVTIYVLLCGGELNGPIIGGIFTVMGFAFVGKTVRSAIPILLGVYLAALCHLYDSASTAALLAAIFGTNLCPLSGYFGFIPGVVAGFLHMLLVVSTSFLNSGLNLYHNGFSGAFVAAVLVPILYALRLRHQAIPETAPEAYTLHPNLQDPEHEAAVTAAALAAEEMDEDLEAGLHHWGS